MARKTRYCVWYTQTCDPRSGRLQGVGDGVTSPSAVLMGVYSSKDAARRALSRFRSAHCPAGQPVPELDVVEYHWTDFVSDQEIRDILGDVGTCRARRREIREGARRRASSLLAGRR